MKKVSLVLLIGVLSMTKSFGQKKALFVVAGQSNSVGQGTAEQSVQVKGALEYRSKGDSLVPLRDPVGENALDFQAANTGSAWPAFAQRYQELTGRQVVIVATARGGSSAHNKAELSGMGTWYPEGKIPLFNNSVRKIQQAEKKTKAKVKGIIWLQGERDANAIFDHQLTPEEYETTLENLIKRFRSELHEKVPFYIVLTGNQQGREPIGNQAVRAAQRNVASRLSKVYVVYEDAEHFADKNWMKDFVHYNQEALNHIGKTVAERIVTKK
ncbi:MAG: sialate O-acetylesterase [Siphonobacter sp.]